MGSVLSKRNLEDYTFRRGLSVLKDAVFVWNPKKFQVSVLSFLHQARNV
jgi:hypothetical protein